MRFIGTPKELKAEGFHIESLNCGEIVAIKRTNDGRIFINLSEKFVTKGTITTTIKKDLNIHLKTFFERGLIIRD